MLAGWFHPFLALIAERYSNRRDCKIRFLMVQIELLREHVPGDRVIPSPEERFRLMKLGSALDHRVDGLIGIVTAKTYKRWRCEEIKGRSPGRLVASGK